MRLYKAFESDQTTTRIKTSLDGALVASLSGRQALTLWNSFTFERLASFDVGAAFLDFAFSFDRAKIVLVTKEKQPNGAFSKDSRLWIFNIASRSLENEYSVDRVYSVTFLPEQGAFATGRLGEGNNNNKIDFFETASSFPSHSIELPEYELPFELVVLSGPKILISLGIGLVAWDLATQTILKQVHCDNLKVNWDIWETTCCFGLGEQKLVAVGFCPWDNRTHGPKICLLDTTSWQVVKWFMDDSKYPTSVAISPDARWLAATYSDEKTTRVWSIADGSQHGECIGDGVKVCAFTPDNRFLIIGANPPDSLTLWEL